jgi:large subunit ribosomal protein L29
MTDEELKKRIIEEENNLVDLRFALATKQLTNTAKIKLTRRDIARMKTVLRERELGLNRKTDSGKKEEK